MDIFERDLNFGFHSATSRSTPRVTRFDEPNVEISLVLEGSLRFLQDGKIKETMAPCATFQAYQHNLTVVAPPDVFVRTMWCNFSANDVGERDWKRLLLLPPALPIPSLLPALFRGALDIQSDDISGEGAIARQVTNSLGRAILAEYLRNADRQHAQPPLPKAVKLVKTSIDDGPFLPWTLGKLAEISATNPTYLIDLFKNYVGMTPIRYLWDRRLSIAVQMLQTTDKSIDQTAHDCGFQSAAHLSRRIKERYGRSPTRLRSR